MIKCVKKVQKPYTTNELDLLLKKPNLKTCSFTEYRDWVIINYLLATANRVKTLINIQIGDLDLDNSNVLLRHMKNGKQQILPLSSSIVKILSEYLKYRKGSNDDYLFCSRYGQKLTRNALEHSIKKYNLKCGVTKTAIHHFRNTFSIMYLQNGGDSKKLQAILGHSTSDMVNDYVDLVQLDLTIDFDKNNPLELLVRDKYNKNAIKMVK